MPISAVTTITRPSAAAIPPRLAMIQSLLDDTTPNAASDNPITTAEHPSATIRACGFTGRILAPIAGPSGKSLAMGKLWSS
jgi:hypothetical protein